MATDNAVKTHVWIAVSIYVLVAILKKELGSKLSLTEILQILSGNTTEIAYEIKPNELFLTFPDACLNAACPDRWTGGFLCVLPCGNAAGT